MSNIVSIVNGEALTTSTAIATGVRRPHKNIIELIRQNISDFEEFGPCAFETRKGKPLPQGGFAKPTEYALLNEHQATLLITFLRNTGVVKAFKKRLVKAFFEMRDQLHGGKPDNKPLTTLELIDLMRETEVKRLEAESTAKRLSIEVEEAKPKTEFYDKVVRSEDAISVSDAAKILGTGQKRLFSFLRQRGWVTRKNEPYQAKINSGHMDVKLSNWEHPTQGLQRSVTPLITGKGLAELQKLFRNLNVLRNAGGVRHG